MLTLTYDPVHGIVAPDARVEQQANHIIQQYLNAQSPTTVCYHEVTIGSDMFLSAFRVLVKRGVISSEQVQVKFKDTLIRIDKFGTLEYWPQDFADYGDKFLSELIDWNEPVVVVNIPKEQPNEI